MDSIFERLVLQEVERLDPHASTGRPRALSDEQTLCHIFRVLRTGMQWREVETEVSHTTILQREKDVPLALAYGSWGAVAGRPDAPCNKGIPPCLGRGLRQKLSKHFLVICTPEQYTSKTCSLCGSTCGPCEEVDAEHRLKLLAQATTESETRRAMRFSVRGLRHCHNEHCAAHLNRDHNASVNIHRRCLSLLSDAPVHTPSDDVDAALETLHTWMIS